MKSELKKFLKNHGVNKIKSGSGSKSLSQAKTSELIQVASKLGYPED